jgi:hypothetical protein
MITKILINLCKFINIINNNFVLLVSRKEIIKLYNQPNNVN